MWSNVRAANHGNVKTHKYKKDAEKEKRMNEISRAEELTAVYNNFSISPLQTKEEFQKFYVPRPTPSIESIKERIERSQENEQYLHGIQRFWEKHRTIPIR